jgi:hypothetical protein
LARSVAERIATYSGNQPRRRSRCRILWEQSRALPAAALPQSASCSSPLDSGRRGYRPGMGFPRALTEHEREVLLLLLPREGFEDVDVYRAQVDAATVTGMCSCGCATINLEVDPKQQRETPHRGRLLSDFATATAPRDS